MSSKPQLLYFAEFPGRGEIVRVLYHYAGVEFEDNKTPIGDFGSIKNNVDDLPLGFLPVLTTPCGKKISQTTTIIRYIADELKLFGKNNVERALIDSTIVSNKEIADKAVEIVFFTKEESEKEKKRVELSNLIDKFFAYFERLVKANGGEFINGKEITVADIYLLDVVDFVNMAAPGNKYLEKYSAMKNICEKVAGTSNLNKYIESRKQ